MASWMVATPATTKSFVVTLEESIPVPPTSRRPMVATPIRASSAVNVLTPS